MPVFSKPVPPPALAHHQRNGEFFTNASHTTIYGSSFSVNNSISQSSIPEGFRILLKHVAPAAIHNSKQRVDPPRCHPHTREAVLDEIFDWIMANVPRETWIAWLNGAAGAGKSAICQSITERCIQRGILVASFFFFRTDSTRNKIDPLVATLAYQIIQLLPDTKDYIIHAIELNPLIFEQTFEEQLDILIVRPLQLLQISNPELNIVFIIDGVDECAGEKIQMNLIRTMTKLMRTRDLPFIVLFGSRRENHILTAFHPRDMNGLLSQIPLDDNYHAEEDILCFLNDSFGKIKQTHPFCNSLAASWPSPNDIQQIVRKSSGQFIYASVVINFISHPSGSPSARLDMIRGLRPSGKLTPFAELDALYFYLFSQVEDLPTTLDALAHLIFSGDSYPYQVACFFQLEEADVQSILAPLASVVFCDINDEYQEITFHHASFPDFLQDKARSKQYCINALATPLCIHWFKAAQSGCFRDSQFETDHWAIQPFLEHAEATDELYESMILYTPSQTPILYNIYWFPGKFLTSIQNMNFGDGGKAYNNMLNIIALYIHSQRPHCIQSINLEDNDDISRVLRQLAIEDGEYWSGSASDAESENEESNGASTSTEELESDIQPLASFTDVEETLPLPFSTQFDDPYEDRDHRITDIYATSSLSEQTSNSPLQKRRRNSSTPNPQTKRRKDCLY